MARPKNTALKIDRRLGAGSEGLPTRGGTGPAGSGECWQRCPDPVDLGKVRAGFAPRPLHPGVAPSSPGLDPVPCSVSAHTGT